MNKILKPPYIAMMVAPPKSGKTTLIRSIIHAGACQGLFKHGWVFSTTLWNGDYDFMPPFFCHAGLTKERLQKIMQYQNRSRQPAFLVLDDMLGAFNPNDPIWTQLFTTSRHYNLTIFLTAQYLRKLPPVARTCTDYVFIFNQFDELSFKALHSAFLQDKKNWSEAKDFITQHTGDYRFVLVRNFEPPRHKYIFSRTPPKRIRFKLQFGRQESMW